LVYLLVKDAESKRDCSIPGPKGLPILGNTLEATKNFPRVLDWHLESCRKYGETWTFTVFGQPRRIITASPRNIEHILKTNFNNYIKGADFTSRAHDFLGDGIFNIDGEKWYVQRKVASNIFNVKNFRENMCQVFLSHGKEVMELLDGLKPGEAINMHDVFHRYTLDCIGEIAFGTQIGSIKDSQVPFARAFDFAQFVILQRFTSPIWRLRPYYSNEEAQFRKSMQVLNEGCYKVIKEKRKEFNETKGNERDENEKPDLLSLFMNKSNTDGQEYDDVYLRDLMMNFVIAGRDTTANALSWAFYRLTQHPDVEQKLIEEIDATFGDNEPDYSVKMMKYATAFVSETLRLHPSVPKDPKFIVADDVLPDGQKVKAGDWIVYAPWAMGRLTSVWGPDAEEFKPERWLDDETKPSPYKFPVFQAGPRICLGQDMAYLEIKTLLCVILQKYRLKLVPGQAPITYQNNITLPMRDFSMMMYAEKRVK